MAREQDLDAPTIHGAWLIAPMLLLALASALRLAARGKDSDFAICFGLLLGLGVIWVGMRLCLPPPAPPMCPHCRRRALVRLVPESACGARCLHCGWRDETADARLLAAPLAVPSPRGAAHAARTMLAPRERTREASPGSRARGRPRGGFGRGRRLG